MTKTKRFGGVSKGQKADADYDVGYGRPPEATQFKPGRSGNPNGRPKGAKSEDTIVRSVMHRKVALKSRRQSPEGRPARGGVDQDRRRRPQG